MNNLRVVVQQEPFDAGAEIAALQAQSTAHGAIATFIGVMRDRNEGESVSAMTLEHYPAMTEKALTEIAEQAFARWPLGGITMIHRVGELHPGDAIVFVGVTSEHRGEAFSGCEFLMDYLKTGAPLWKKETTSAGTRWVDARDSDAAAKQRWQK